MGKGFSGSKWLGLAAGLPIFLAAACGGNGGVATTGGGGQPSVSYSLGDPLQGLTAQELAAFDHGKDEFGSSEDAADGLGPVFNGTSCAQCHSQGAEGGSAPDIQIARVTRIGGSSASGYTDLSAYGGPVLQARSLKEFDPTYLISGEVVPPQATFVSHRITTPLFGAGLIEAIPAGTILARTAMHLPDGIHGVANIVHNPETNQDEVGRFGWKAQHSSLHVFAADAYLNEMGITSALFPNDNLPQGVPFLPGQDGVADPEDQDGDTEAFTAFMKFLAPPTPSLPITMQQARGEKLFNDIKCSLCHVPAMTTGANASQALAYKTVPLYSDLLLHRMGPSLADGIVQSKAKGDQFKTAPLWGLGHRVFFLHDGRATTIEQAVLMHDGEARPASDRFAHLPLTEKAAILAFLGGL